MPTPSPRLRALRTSEDLVASASRLEESARAPTLRLSEVFRSLQGEGPSQGCPCVFLRLAHCNLRCRWCDTAYTWDFARYSYEAEVRTASVSDLARELGSSLRLVVTGGEPLLQQAALAALMDALPPSVVVEVESNGTLPPNDALRMRVDQWNLSPKLSNSGEPPARALNDAALLVFRKTDRAWLKFVVAGEADFDEAESLIRRLAWRRERVLFMAQAATRAELRERGARIAHESARRGYGYTSRLHVELWDAERGR